MYKCISCDGTALIHSHNPKCPSCKHGTVSKDKAIEQIYAEIIPEVRLIHQMAGKKWTSKDIDECISSHLIYRG